ncbi:MAG: arginase [Chloroflexi bacterium]|nr:arginase [Chloroflexota bacterium]
MQPLFGETSVREQHDRPAVAILGVPSSLGAPAAGMEEAPAVVRSAGLAERLRHAGLEVQDWGDIPVPAPDAPGVGEVRNERALRALAETTRARVGAALDEGLSPLVLGGDHSISLGSVAASAMREPIGILWLDAHGDFNTPATSPSGAVYGMVLAILAGLGPQGLLGLAPPVPGPRIALLGARALDPGERKNLHQAGVAVYTTQAIRALGAEQAAERAIAGLLAAGARRIHVSVDLDALDPSVAPGVWTRAVDGLTLEEMRAILRVAAHTGRVAALDITELLPARDRGGTTTRAALQLIKAALGSKRPVQALDWRATEEWLGSLA